MLISLGKAKGRAQEGYPKSAARGIIEAGAPAFGCTVHPLRLQAPRAAYAHKSPGQGDCTATPGWPGGRDGRKSIKSKIIDTKAADCAIVGNMPYLRWTASPAKNVSPGRARMPPKDTPARSRLDMHLANFGETPERELRQNGVLRGCADRSWSAGRTAFPSVVHPAFSNQPPHDDHHLRERHPEIDHPPYPLRTPHQFLMRVMPRVRPLRHPTLP